MFRLAVALVLSCVIVPISQADTILIDFESIDGSFQSLAEANVIFQGGGNSINTLRTTDNTSTLVDFSLSGNFGFIDGTISAGQVPSHDLGFDLSRIADSLFIPAESGNTGEVVGIFSGLTPNTSFDVIVFTHQEIDAIGDSPQVVTISGSDSQIFGQDPEDPVDTLWANGTQTTNATELNNLFLPVTSSAGGEINVTINPFGLTNTDFGSVSGILLQGDFSSSSVPEPSSLCVMIGGFIFIGSLQFRKKVIAS